MWSLLDFAFTLLPIVLYIEFLRKAKNWGGQFIEISANQVSFKTRDSGDVAIAINDITHIEIKLEQIIIRKSDATEHTIIVEDFTEYEDRMAIKSNFTELKARINISEK